MQLIHKPENVGNMLDHMATNYFFKFIVSEWVGIGSEIVNHVCVTRAVRVDADRSGKLVLTTAYVKNFFG